MSRYATREDAMDGLLRRQVFVDLLQVVRQGVVASVESYSIKAMEPFYGFVREQDLVEAIRARARMDAALDSGGVSGGVFPPDLEVIRPLQPRRLSVHPRRSAVGLKKATPGTHRPHRSPGIARW